MREWLRSASFIARADLSFMLRQRETLLWVFAMPLLFFYFIGTVTGGFGGSDPNRPDPLAFHSRRRAASSMTRSSRDCRSRISASIGRQPRRRFRPIRGGS